MWTKCAFGRVYIWLGVPHVRKCPAHWLGTYIRLLCEHATGCDRVLGAGSLRATAAQRVPVAHLSSA